MSFVLSDTIYEVLTRFRVDSRVPGIRGVQQQLRGLNSTVNQVTRSFLLIAAFNGLRRLTGAVVNLNQEVQSAETSIGAVFAVLTDTPIDRSIRIARRELRGLRADAARLPGELSDFVRTYQQIVAPVVQAGGNQTDLRELTRLGISAAFAVNPQTGIRNIGFDITQALTTGLRGRNTRDLAIILRTAGVTEEAFNRLNPRERLEQLRMAFARYEDAAEVMGRTFQAQTATLRDNVAEIVRTLTRPLFDAVTDDLIIVNDWIEKNGDAIDRWAQRVSVKLVGAYEKLKAVLPGLGQFAAGPGAALGGLAVGGGLARGLGAGAAAAGTGIGAPLALGITFLSGVLARAAAEFPQLSASIGVGLLNLGRSFARLAGAAAELITANPIMRELGRAMLDSADLTIRALTALTDGLAGILESISAALNVIPLEVLIGGLQSAAPHVVGPLQVARLTRDAISLALRSRFPGPSDFPIQGPPVPPDLAGEDLNAAPVTNINGPVSIEIRPERIDNPNLLARDIQAIFDYLGEFREGAGRVTLVPRGA